MSTIAVRAAAHMLRRGGVIAYATESVFGLGCDPFNPAAVARLLHLKKRPQAKGLIVIAADWAQLRPLLLPVDTVVQSKIEASWPGAVTWVLPAHAWVPRWLRGKHSSLAVRVPGHAQARALCAAFGGPVVSTSANPSGRPAARTSRRVRQYFGKRIEFVLPGTVGGAARPSEIRDGIAGWIVRQ